MYPCLVEWRRLGSTGHRDEMQDQSLPWRLNMSDHNGTMYSTAEGIDYPEHEKTYKSFVKGGTIFASTAGTILALMAVFLT
jgi:hypothetical protein